MSTCHFTAVDLDAVLDEFEFHEGEAERRKETREKKKEPAGIFSPVRDDEEDGGNSLWEAKEESSRTDTDAWEGKNCSMESSSSSPPRYDEPFLPDTAKQVEREEAPEEKPPAPSSSSSSSSSSASSSSSSSLEISPPESPPANDQEGDQAKINNNTEEDFREAESRREEIQGARPKISDREDVPPDSPPPYSEIDPMIEEEDEEFVKKLSRPTSLALPPPPIRNSNEVKDEEGEVKEEGRGNDGEEAPSSGDRLPSPSEDAVLGPPGSTPAIPNVSVVPNFLQGLSEDQLVLGKVSPWWVPDSDALSCMICDSKFTLTKRRHHCRACGKVLCSQCCSDKFNLAYMDCKEARVCKPCKGILERLKRAEEMYDSNARDENNSSRESIAPSETQVVPNRPNPSNPMEYCSTVPPVQQVAATGGAQANPPSVMVPVGVLKHWDNAPSQDRRVSTELKQVMFSDGIRPGGDLTDLDGSSEHQSLSRRSKSEHKSSRRSSSGQSDIARSMLPLEGLPYVSGVGPANPKELADSFRKGSSVAFSVNRNLRVYVSLIFYAPSNSDVWNYRTDGLTSVGQDEIVFLLVKTEQDNDLPPRDIFDQIQKLYERARKGNSVYEMSHSVVLSGDEFLKSTEYGGFLFIRQSFQCVQNLDLPEPPFLFAILITKWEVPWARVFPLRLMLRLGAECRYYPCPLWSIRGRNTVYKEIGNTIMKLLSDLRNFTYSLPIIKGLVIHMEDKLTTVLLPKNRYKLVQKALQNSNYPVLALGANFSPTADSHLVTVQRNDHEPPKNPMSSSDYETQAINILNGPRKVTGASFIVFNAALKSSSGLTAKSSIVEDGIMVQVSQDKMMDIRKTLQEMGDYEIGCGPVESADKPDEIVSVKWVEDDKTVNVGIKSPIDHTHMDGIASIRIHSGPDYRGDRHLIRCTEIFFFPSDSESTSADTADLSKVTELIVKSVCHALVPHLKSLKQKMGLGVIGVRATLDSEKAGYEAGGKGKYLPPEFMNSLDNELIPVIHSQSVSSKTTFEFIFRILDT